MRFKNFFIIFFITVYGNLSIKIYSVNQYVVSNCFIYLRVLSLTLELTGTRNVRLKKKILF